MEERMRLAFAIAFLVIAVLLAWYALRTHRRTTEYANTGNPPGFFFRLIFGFAAWPASIIALIASIVIFFT